MTAAERAARVGDGPAGRDGRPHMPDPQTHSLREIGIMPFGTLPRPARVATSAAAAILIAGIATGCFQTQKASDPQQKASHPSQANLTVDPAGRWCFKDGSGKSATNRIEVVEGGIIASPLGRTGNEVFYPQAGPNLYRLGSGAAYEFYDSRRAVWRRGDTAYPQQRCG